LHLVFGIMQNYWYNQHFEQHFATNKLRDISSKCCKGKNAISYCNQIIYNNNIIIINKAQNPSTNIKVVFLVWLRQMNLMNKIAHISYVQIIIKIIKLINIILVIWENLFYILEN
jgi:hypothetical protein